jgi:asparagine synthase (glutamine-hydrolysing)
MCGIAGVIHTSDAVAVAAVRRMNDAQTHRGPDGVGACSVRVGAHAIALGHRRLAIQDLSPTGRQPMVNPATDDVITYNGEIYNVAELRAELAGHGAAFRSRSDTEVVLAAFARWGIACVERLYGMFAFALYAARERKLYLARDPMGIKPLYWTTSGGSFVFASELRAVLASGLVDVRIDRLGLESLFAYGAVVAPRTMVEGVHLLEPGTWAQIDVAGRAFKPQLQARRYWHFASTPRMEGSSKVVADEIRPALRESVQSHLVGDVPVAVFLSSGIDSTAISVLASEVRRGDLDTFTVSLAEDSKIDEAPVARRTAQGLGTRHHDVLLGERDALGLTTRWLDSIDQPSVDGLNTYVISGAAREQGIVVALSGMGGDEMFGGYATFREVPRLARAVRAARHLPRGLVRRVADRWAHGSATRAEKMLDFLDLKPSLESVCLWRRRLMSDAQMEALGLQSRRREDFLPPESDPHYGVPRDSAWAAVRALESRFYLSNMLLRDADVFGMAHGLEIRVPLLDRRVVDAALAFAPPAFDWGRRRVGKPWLVAALDGRIPPEVLGRSKRGFSLPQARWMRGPLREAFEARVDAVAGSGQLEPHAVRAIWERFLREPDGPAWSRAWLLGVVGQWLARTLSSETRPDASEAVAGR